MYTLVTHAGICLVKRSRMKPWQTGCESWLSSNVKRQAKEEVGLELLVQEGGSNLCGSQCKTSPLLLCSFHPSLANKRQAKLREHSERQRRARAHEQPDKPKSEMVARLRWQLFTLATAPDQLKLYWSVRTPMWVFEPISCFGAEPSGERVAATGWTSPPGGSAKTQQTLGSCAS